MIISLNQNTSKGDIFKELTKKIQSFDFEIESNDFSRPWGGFFVINEDQVEYFISKFFPNLKPQKINFSQKLSPKILVVAPENRLSWQYHDRRAEIWRVIVGPVAVKRSDSDEEGKLQVFNVGETIYLKQGERHRLIGLDQWGVVAEIWQHTQNIPSDENDIHRLQDDFGR